MIGKCLRTCPVGCSPLSAAAPSWVSGSRSRRSTAEPWASQALAGTTARFSVEAEAKILTANTSASTLLWRGGSRGAGCCCRTAVTAALALEDCWQCRLVTGADAAALERKDLFSGNTPLIMQIQLGERENVERLLLASANADACTAGRESALEIAFKEGRDDIVETLVGLRASLSPSLRELESQPAPKVNGVYDNSGSQWSRARWNKSRWCICARCAASHKLHNQT